MLFSGLNLLGEVFDILIENIRNFLFFYLISFLNYKITRKHFSFAHRSHIFCVIIL